MSWVFIFLTLRYKPCPTKPEPRWKRNKNFKSREEDEKWNMQAWARNLSTKKLVERERESLSNSHEILA